ncbi:MAG: putative DNA binding domain-containing protein [Candidatus Saganbacteria bacterium]|nr:putative DNA binding domain-containing protein [Candidatus Saganbacteria bacterium]
MFSEELKSYINHGSEETNIEYKASMRWYRNPTTKDEKVANVKFIRTMLAMSNHIYGGIIVVGVKQKENGICEPKGMRKRDYDSFNYDHISRSIKEHSNPWIQFKNGIARITSYLH